MIFLFAFSTLIGNYYYGETNIEFLGANKIWLNIYRIAVIGMVLFGAVATVPPVWGLADLFMGLMVIVNLIAITMLSKVAFAALKDYTRQKKEGKDPVFYKNAVPNNEKIECWDDEPATLKRITDKSKSSGQLIRAFSLCQKFKYKFVDDLWFLMIDPMRSIIDKDQLAIGQILIVSFASFLLKICPPSPRSCEQGREFVWKSAFQSRLFDGSVPIQHGGQGARLSKRACSLRHLPS